MGNLQSDQKPGKNKGKSKGRLKGKKGKQEDDFTSIVPEDEEQKEEQVIIIVPISMGKVFLQIYMKLFCLILNHTLR